MSQRQPKKQKNLLIPIIIGIIAIAPVLFFTRDSFFPAGNNSTENNQISHSESSQQSVNNQNYGTEIINPGSEIVEDSAYNYSQNSTNTVSPIVGQGFSVLLDEETKEKFEVSTNRPDSGFFTLKDILNREGDFVTLKNETTSQLKIGSINTTLTQKINVFVESLEYDYQYSQKSVELLLDSQLLIYEQEQIIFDGREVNMFVSDYVTDYSYSSQGYIGIVTGDYYYLIGYFTNEPQSEELIQEVLDGIKLN